MSSFMGSKNLKNNLPNKKIFIMMIFFILLLTMGSFIVLANENTVVVEADILNVRYGPGLSHEVLTKAEEKDRLYVLGEENKWYKVQLENGNIGWVASWLVDNNNLINKKDKFVRVNTPSVNIRQFANSESKILGVVHENTELQVLYEDGIWYQILYMGQVAWIHGDYTDTIDELSKNDTTNNKSIVMAGNQQTNVRLEPSLDSEIIYASEPNEEFIYLETVDNWYHIELSEGRKGYIASSVSSIIDNYQPDENLNISNIGKVNSLAEATIVIDAGHGGNDSGAISANKSIYEKDLTLDTAILLKNRLEDAGTNVILTRNKEHYVSLDERVSISQQNNADAFISLHYDAVEQSDTMSGTTTYYQIESNLDLAQTVNKYLKNQGTLPNNGVRTADYKVLRENTQPAILLELGYMNHHMDTKLINSSSYQATIVEAIYQGLTEYYNK